MAFCPEGEGRKTQPHRVRFFASLLDNERAGAFLPRGRRVPKLQWASEGRPQLIVGQQRADHHGVPDRNTLNTFRTPQYN